MEILLLFRADVWVVSIECFFCRRLLPAPRTRNNLPKVQWFPCARNCNVPKVLSGHCFVFRDLARATTAMWRDNLIRQGIHFLIFLRSLTIGCGRTVSVVCFARTEKEPTRTNETISLAWNESDQTCLTSQTVQRSLRSTQLLHTQLLASQFWDDGKNVKKTKSGI